jgi:hypothetical protein
LPIAGARQTTFALIPANLIPPDSAGFRGKSITPLSRRKLEFGATWDNHVADWGGSHNAIIGLRSIL